MRKKCLILSFALLFGAAGCAVSPSESQPPSSEPPGSTGQVTSAPSPSSEESPESAPTPDVSLEQTPDISPDALPEQSPDAPSVIPNAPNPETPGEPLAMSLGDTPSVGAFLGFGAETDFYFTLNKNTERGVGPDDIAMLTARMKEMKLAAGRVFFSYNWWEPIEGRRGEEFPVWLDFLNSLTMMKEAGAEVNICPWGDYFGYAPWQKVSFGQRSPEGEALAKTADSLCEMLRYLIVDLGYTNIRYLTLVNEPDNQSRDNPYDHGLYMELAVLVDQTLRDMGIRDRLYIVGADASSWSEGVDPWFRDTFDADTGRIFDGYASHSYKYNVRAMAMVEQWIGRRVKLLSEITEKHTDLIVGEFGMYGEENGTYWQPKTLTYEYGLFIGAFSLTAVNHGAAQVLYWNLTDTYVTLDNSSASPGDINFRTGYGLWQYKDKNNWEAKPGYYSYSMLSSKTAKGDSVYPVVSGNEDVFGSAFVSPSGELTVSVVNLKDTAYSVTMDLGETFDGRMLDYYPFSEEALPVNSRLIPKSGAVTVTGGKVVFHVPANGMAVVSER